MCDRSGDKTVPHTTTRSLDGYTRITRVRFQFDRKGKAVLAACDMPDTSSDGRAILRKGIDTQFELRKRVAACLDDGLQPGKLRRQILELVRRRVFRLACGYADCNDAALVAQDPIHKFFLGRDSLDSLALAAQPTLSRFESAVAWAAFCHLAQVLAGTEIEHHRRLKGRAARITIDR
jgi:Transposase DDE domain group 1